MDVSILSSCLLTDTPSSPSLATSDVGVVLTSAVSAFSALHVSEIVCALSASSEFSVGVVSGAIVHTPLFISESSVGVVTDGVVSIPLGVGVVTANGAVSAPLGSGVGVVTDGDGAAVSASGSDVGVASCGAVSAPLVQESCVVRALLTVSVPSSS